MIPSGAARTGLQGRPSDFRRWEPGYLNANYNPVGGHGGQSHAKRTTFVRATVQLLDAYKCAKPGFDFQRTLPRRCLTNPSEPVSNYNFDNLTHDLILRVDDTLADPSTGDEYIVVDLLGTGTFGQVAKCWHKQSGIFLAVKIVKNQQAYFNQAWVEINILRMLHRNNSSDDARHVVRFISHFVFQGHLCLVFEKLSINLYELLKQNRYAGVSMELLRTFLEQLLKALNVLVKSEVVHCDVKPENILLSSVDKAEVKLIDFGSACQLQHPVYTYVQSRFYRSPEILLGLPSYDSKIDMWSLGCVAGELFLGIPMFPGQDEMNMLCRITEMLGDFPDMFVRRCRLTGKFYNETRSGDDIRVFHLKSVEQYEQENNVSLAEWKRYFKEKTLRDIIMACSYQSQMRSIQEAELRESFIDLLGGMLTIDPIDRWTPAEALLHPFITSGPLPNGQPWHPPGRMRRHAPRSRPVLIDAAMGGTLQDTYSASAPTFAGYGPFAHSSSQSVEPSDREYPGPGPQNIGSGSYIPGPSFPAFRSAMMDGPLDEDEGPTFLRHGGRQGQGTSGRRRFAMGTEADHLPSSLPTLSGPLETQQGGSFEADGISRLGERSQSHDTTSRSRSRNVPAVHQLASPRDPVVSQVQETTVRACAGQDSFMVDVEDSVFGFWSDDELGTAQSSSGNIGGGTIEYLDPNTEPVIDVPSNAGHVNEATENLHSPSTSRAQRPPLHGRAPSKTRVARPDDNRRKK
jgi:serine/threonine protein kinase